MQYLQFAAQYINPQNLHVKRKAKEKPVTYEWFAIVFWFYQCSKFLVTLNVERTSNHSSAKFDSGFRQTRLFFQTKGYNVTSTKFHRFVAHLGF